MDPQVGHPMTCRQVSFFIDPAHVPGAFEAVARNALPMFLQLPSFRGYLALQAANGIRREIIVQTFWDDLDAAEDASKTFIGAVYGAAGTNPSRRTFEVLGAMLRTEERLSPGDRKVS